MANSIKRCMTIMAIEMTKRHVTNYGEEGGLIFGFPLCSDFIFLFRCFDSFLFLRVCSVSKDLADKLHLSGRASLTRSIINIAIKAKH